MFENIINIENMYNDKIKGIQYFSIILITSIITISSIILVVLNSMVINGMLKMVPKKR